ncbi:response regulator transcription factor [Luteolibacter flavescens]|uniref:Response regulator transcription factor n=1 Tax=Luteolibacter flavescens TaxID=1859460 RepID=A0ABT3FQS6_9BACT|nr:response regulator transcription factor [Luteolibacter flavescens]MCW1885941.1 response regulator transcription factor [Luteolibacter flavescens]
MPKIFVVDDHPMLRGGLRHSIGAEPEWTFCGEAANAAEALTLIPQVMPDLVIMDITLPDKSGLELIKDLQALCPSIPVLVFSMHDELLYAERVIRAGGRGYLMKGSSTEQFLKAMMDVLRGSLYLSERVAGQILNRLGRGNTRSGLSSLTDRELEVFEMIGRGVPTPQIGETLHISPRTVDAHRTNIRLKLGLADAPAVMREAVVWVEMGGTAKNVIP